MSDNYLASLVNRWCRALDYPSAFSAVCEVADYLGLSRPETEKDYRGVLNYLATNHLMLT